MVPINDFTITSIETISAFDMDGNYLFTLDELQNATISNSEEVTDITGRQGRKISTLKKNKSATVSGTNGFMSAGLIELQTGNSFQDMRATGTNVRWTEYTTVESTGHTATLTYKAQGTAGSEITALYTKNADGTLDAELKQVSGSAPEADEFTYNATTKVLTFNTALDGSEIVVFYDRKISAVVLDNDSDNYAAKCQLYVDAMGEDKCGKVYRIQFYFPKVDFNGEFSLEFGDNQSVHSFEASALAGGCTTGGTLWTYTIYGANEGEYVAPEEDDD